MAKTKVKQALATFLKGILAGICISLGSALFLVVTNLAGKFAAGLVFPLGMLLILNLGYFLYTGKVCFLFNHLKRGPNLHYSLQLLVGLIGNLLGAFIIGAVLSFVFDKVPAFKETIDGNEVVTTMVEYGRTVIEGKVNNHLGKVFVLAILCNILIYFCVEGFSKVENQFVKHLIVFLTIGTFNILGFEHAIADMFYISFGGYYGSDSFVFLLVVIAGNTVGGLIIPLVVKLIKLLEKR